MGNALNLRRSRNNAFNHALTFIQSKLTVVNAIFILLAVGAGGKLSDYLMASGYLIWGIALFFIADQVFVSRYLRPVLPFFDIAVTGYMICRTGGQESPLFAFSFIPILVSVVRSRYLGIITWSTVAAVIFVLGAGLNGTLEWRTLSVKVGYLYLFGIFGGYLIDRTYMVAEEVSNQLARRNDDLKRLTADFNYVSGSSDVEQIFEKTLKIIEQNQGASMMAVMVFNDRGDLKITRAQGWSTEDIQRYHCYPLTRYSLIMAPLMAFKKPLLLGELTRHAELVKTFQNINIKSFFAFPLVVQEEVVGVVSISASRSRDIPEEDVEILTSIVNQAGITIQNVLSFQEEQKKANTDGLTGLFNRRYFNEQIETLTMPRYCQGMPVSLILMDVDNFKKYNDSFGHPAGDVLLRNVARVVMEAVREQDIPARYGGEEFAVILPHLDNRKAIEVAERIRVAIEGIRDLKRRVTVSVGVATLPDQATNWSELVEYADKSLYYAKHTGKNRVSSTFKG